MKNTLRYAVGCCILAHWIVTAFTLNSLWNTTENGYCNSELDFCECSIQDALTMHEDAFTVLNQLVQEPYFRYFKVNLSRSCPFWAVTLLCNGGADTSTPDYSPCTVHKCKSNEIPSHIKNEKCADEVQLPPEDQRDLKVQRGTSTLALNAFNRFHDVEWDHPLSGSWLPPVDLEQEANHIDLRHNPESNTYYRGMLANRIWDAIYQENCFQFTSLNGTCTREELFYRLISGLHASISTHLSVNYSIISSNINAQNITEYTFAENRDEFDRRVGQHPERIRNLFTIYLFVARSVSKVRDLLNTHVYNITGDSSENTKIQHLMKRLTSSKLMCNPTFDESRFIKEVKHDNDIDSEFANLMQLKLHNITRLMDCLTCEKCRLWGKLQTLGFGTALRIMMSEVKILELGDLPNLDGTNNSTFGNTLHHIITSLQRSEIVALINFFRQLAYSVQNVQRLLNWNINVLETNETLSTMGMLHDQVDEL